MPSWNKKKQKKARRVFRSQLHHPPFPSTPRTNSRQLEPGTWWTRPFQSSRNTHSLKSQPPSPSPPCDEFFGEFHNQCQKSIKLGSSNTSWDQQNKVKFYDFGQNICGATPGHWNCPIACRRMHPYFTTYCCLQMCHVSLLSIFEDSADPNLSRNITREKFVFPSSNILAACHFWAIPMSLTNSIQRNHTGDPWPLWFQRLLPARWYSCHSPHSS